MNENVKYQINMIIYSELNHSRLCTYLDFLLSKSIPVSVRPILGLPIVSNGGGLPASVRVNVVLKYT